jgi:hypothetical protein
MLSGGPRHVFVQGDIGDTRLMFQLLTQNKPRAVPLAGCQIRECTNLGKISFLAQFCHPKRQNQQAQAAYQGKA